MTERTREESLDLGDIDYCYEGKVVDMIKGLQKAVQMYGDSLSIDVYTGDNGDVVVTYDRVLTPAEIEAEDKVRAANKERQREYAITTIKRLREEHSL